jgi:hypothetical protein
MVISFGRNFLGIHKCLNRRAFFFKGLFVAVLVNSCNNTGYGIVTIKFSGSICFRMILLKVVVEHEK